MRSRDKAQPVADEAGAHEDEDDDRIASPPSTLDWLRALALISSGLVLMLTTATVLPRVERADR